MNTFISALMAALILFTSSMVTLFTANPTLEFVDVATATWVSIGGGAMTVFFKDYQALSSRRLINTITKSGDGGI